MIWAGLSIYLGENAKIWNSKVMFIKSLWQRWKFAIVKSQVNWAQSELPCLTRYLPRPHHWQVNQYTILTFDIWRRKYMCVSQTSVRNKFHIFLTYVSYPRKSIWWADESVRRSLGQNHPIVKVKRRYSEPNISLSRLKDISTWKWH